MSASMNLVRGLLHLEGAAIFVAAIWAYFALLDGFGSPISRSSWCPTSMVGYLRGARLGAWPYNLVHTEALPALLLAVGLAANSRPVLLAALLLAAHIGIDRATGYGLKFASGFENTHLQRLG